MTDVIYQQFHHQITNESQNVTRQRRSYCHTIIIIITPLTKPGSCHDVIQVSEEQDFLKVFFKVRILVQRNLSYHRSILLYDFSVFFCFF